MSEAGLEFKSAGPAGSQDSASPLDLTTLDPAGLTGFFEGWPDPPSPARLGDLLAGCAAVELCLERTAGRSRVVGLLTGLTDGVLFLYLPLLEVLPEFRGRGIARQLVERMLARFADLYAVDLVCDDELVPFYEGLGLQPLRAMALRRYDRQGGR